MTATTNQERSAATRASILDAALEEFAVFGYRRSSVDSVSRRAGVSRATMYLHWKGKEPLFRALVERLHEQHLTAMRAAAEATCPTLEEHLIAVLEARFGRFVQLTSHSPNAAELYDAHDRVCGDIAAAAQQQAVAVVTHLLHDKVAAGAIDLGASGLSIEQTATALIDCAHGAKGENPADATPAGFRNRLAALIGLVVNGLTAKTARQSAEAG